LVYIFWNFDTRIKGIIGKYPLSNSIMTHTTAFSRHYEMFYFKEERNHTLDVRLFQTIDVANYFKRFYL
jgi:hypothetical protein